MPRAFAFPLTLTLAALSCALTPGPARAHGEPASALSLIATDGDGEPWAVELSEGLSVRDGERFRFVCPAAFGSELTPLAAALSDDRVLVATLSGLYLMGRNGDIRPHPAEIGSEGRTIALRGRDGEAYWLRASDAGAELWRVDAERAQMLWSSPQAYDSLALQTQAPRRALLSRLSAELVEQRGLSAEGDDVDAWDGQVLAPPASAAVFARVAGEQPYLVVLTQGGLRSVLGRVEDDQLIRVFESGGSISGPIPADGGQLLVAAGGGLLRLDEQGSPQDLSGDAIVTCVGTRRGVRYACADADLRALDGDRLGETLFDLSALGAPKAALLEGEHGLDCELQWTRFGLDLRAAGVMLDDVAADAGTRDAGREPPTAAADADAGTQRPSADGSGPSGGSDDGAGGCGVRTPRQRGRAPRLAALLLLAAVAAGHRRRASAAHSGGVAHNRPRPSTRSLASRARARSRPSKST